jgi:HSP20 family protein
MAEKAIVPRREAGGLARSGYDPFEMMREMLGWDPFRELGRFGGFGGGKDLATFNPSFDVKETKDAYIFKADLPGIKQEDVELSMTGNRLTLSGKREDERHEEGEQYHAYERSYGSFSRSFTLPEGVDLENVQADLRDGVLSVTVPKKPEVQARRIQLKGGTAAGKPEKLKA